MADKMNKLTNELIEKLKQIFAERLISVILYGSCAVDDCDNTFSDINVMVVIDKLTARDLKESASAIKNWQKTKHPLPIFMDKEEWFNSCDIYPIEYSDIKDRHRILYGEDIVNPLIIDYSHLRLQCEHEIKNLLIRLRQTYLGKNNDKKAVENLIKTSSKTFVALFRAVLKLKNSSVPAKHPDVITKISEIAEIEKDLFHKILSFRTNQKALQKGEFDATIQKLIDTTDYLLKYVDKLDNKEK